MRTMSPKNKSLLGRKTKRNNIPMKEEEDNEPKTIIRIIYLGEKKNKKYKDNEYTYIKFSFSKKISLKDLPNTFIQREEFNINSDKIWIKDKIELGKAKTKEKKNFIVSIYINKVNTFYIDLTPKKNPYYFEFIFYSKIIKELPKYINSQYNEKLKEFDDYGLKFRKKICIINTDITIAKDFIEDLDLKPSSYKISVRIKKNGMKSSTVHKLKLEKKINLPKSDIKGNIPDILEIFNLFDDIKGNKSYDYIQKTYKYLNNGNFGQFIKDYEYTEIAYSDIPDINDNDANIFKEHLLKLIINYFFVDDKDSYSKSRNYILKIIENLLGIIWDIENFAKYSENRALFRFRLYRATVYNLYSITIKLPNKNKIICLQYLSQYNQKIINLKEVEDDNPYSKAIDFLKKIALNLDEKSSLFDSLFQYYSGNSKDIILSNEKRDKNRRDINQYELSMITVDELKNHIIKILPNFIIKYIYDKDDYAFYSEYNDIIFVNELKTFKFDDYDDDFYDYSSGQYTLPLVIILLHECWIPYFYLRIENFNEIVEFLLTGEKVKKNNYANYLLFEADIENENLLDVNLWTKPDFKNLRSLIFKNIKEFSKNERVIRCYIPNTGKENEGDSRRFVMETYIIDGVEIGPLFKI